MSRDTHPEGRSAHSAYLADAIHRDRVREAFELEHLEGGVDAIAKPLPRFLAEDDLVGPCLRLQPRREVGRLAENAEIRVLAEASDDGRPGCDADAERDSHVPSAVAHCDCGAQRVARVIHGLATDVEDLHHGIAGELIDRSVM